MVRQASVKHKHLHIASQLVIDVAFEIFAFNKRKASPHITENEIKHAWHLGHDKNNTHYFWVMRAKELAIVLKPYLKGHKHKRVQQHGMG